MEVHVYPEKIDSTLNIMHYAHDVVYRPFFRAIHVPPST